MRSDAQPRGWEVKWGKNYDPNRSAEPLGGPRADGNWPGGDVQALEPNRFWSTS
jgi:hypothetical protein